MTGSKYVGRPNNREVLRLNKRAKGSGCFGKVRDGAPSGIDDQLTREREESIRTPRERCRSPQETKSESKTGIVCVLCSEKRKVFERYMETSLYIFASAEVDHLL